MHILMDKGLRQQGHWPGLWPIDVDHQHQETFSLEPHLAFWRQIYPGKEVCAFDLQLGNKQDTKFWSALSITSHATSSQYDMLRQYWFSEAEKLGPVAWMALTGDGFHGQRQRSWSVLPGNLHLSLGIQPNLAAADYSHALTMLPAVCLMDLLKPHAFAKGKIGIKWVNDVLIGRDKLAGVLTSARTEKGIITGAVLGFGLNITQTPDIPPSSFVQGFTCLEDHLGPQTPSLGELVTSLLEIISQRVKRLQQNGPLQLFEDYKSHSMIIGHHVQIWPEETGGDISGKISGCPLRQGVVQKINPDLGLVLVGQDDPVGTGRLVWHNPEINS